MWSCLSLLCSAIILQSSASNNGTVIAYTKNTYTYQIYITLHIINCINCCFLSSHLVVSLTCRDTVEVVAGEDVTLNCSIIYLAGLICKGEEYQWSDSHGDIQLNSDVVKYTSGWDSLAYVYLNISNIIKEEIYTVKVVTDCDTVDASIKVRVKQGKTTKTTTTSEYLSTF